MPISYCQFPVPVPYFGCDISFCIVFSTTLAAQIPSRVQSGLVVVSYSPSRTLLLISQIFYCYINGKKRGLKTQNYGRPCILMMIPAMQCAAVIKNVRFIIDAAHSVRL